MPVLANALPAVRARDAAAEKRQLDPFESFLSSLLGDDETTTSRSSRTVTTTSARTPAPDTSTTSARSTRTTTRTTPSPPPVPSQATGLPPNLTTRTITSQGAIDTSAPDNTQSGQTQRKGLPAVVIGIIVAAAVIFGLIFIALLARKFFQRRRRNKRTTWGGSMISPYEPPLTKELPAAPIASAFSANPNNNTRNAVGTNSNTRYPDYSTSSTYPAYPPAALGYTSQNNVTPYSPAAPSSAGYTAPYPFGGTGSNAKPSTSANQPARASPAAPTQLSVVKRTFVPSLPDELSIANGETVRVLSIYDDGWALCEKINGGEKGVVPQECLESVKKGASGNTPGQQLAAPDSGMKRNSSLRREDGTRY